MRSRHDLLLVLAFAAGIVAATGCGDGFSSPPSLQGDRPASLAVETIGASVEGRRIEAVSLGSGPSTVLVIGGLHTGPENPTADLAEELLRYFGAHADELPPAVRLVFIPRANPDGYAGRTRLNANGVDLNRNWPGADWRTEAIHGEEVVSGGDAPLSEPETAALYSYINDLSPDVVITLHGYGGLVEPNDSGSSKNYAAAYAKSARYKPIEDWPYYQITGELIEAMNNLDVAALDVELRDGEKSRFGRNLKGVKAVLREVGKTAG